MKRKQIDSMIWMKLSTRLDVQTDTEQNLYILLNYHLRTVLAGFLQNIEVNLLDMDQD